MLWTKVDLEFKILFLFCCGQEAVQHHRYLSVESYALITFPICSFEDGVDTLNV